MYTLSGISTGLRLRHARRLLTAAKDAVESADIDRLSHALHQGKRLLGGVASATLLSDTAIGRIVGSVTHAEASSRLNEQARRLHNSRLDPIGWFVWENLSRAIGCFAASEAFGRFGRERLLQSRIRNDRQRAQVFLAHLYSRDLDGAIQTWHTRTPAPHTSAFWADAGHLLWLLSGGSSGVFDRASSGAWRDTLAGSTVLALGPAPTSIDPDAYANARIARVATPGVTGWPAGDILRGRVDLTYANSDSAKWFVAHHERTLFDSVEFASFRTSVWKRLDLSNGRTAYNHKALLPMPFDKTNMIPLIVWDVSHVPDASIHVAGTTFFASPTAYTAQDVRLKEDRGAHTDQRGSTGLRFERCLSFSSHQLSAHHTLMAMLSEAGVVRFDTDGANVVTMSTAEYLSSLDELYGVDAV